MLEPRTHPAPDIAPAFAGPAAILRLWTGLAVGALAIAGVFAFLLALSRTPGVEALIGWPIAFFQKGLVIHVVFSFVVWFTAMLGAMLTLDARHPPRAGNAPFIDLLAPSGVLVAFPLLFVPALLDRGEPTLNNYVPAIVDPLYYAGLIVLALSMALMAARQLAGAARHPSGLSAISWILNAAAFGFIVALACFAIAVTLISETPLGFDYNEQVMWGGGHVLQVVNTLVVIAAWAWLASRLPSRSALDRRWLIVSLSVLMAAAVVAPSFYLVFEPFLEAQTQAFTNLQYFLGPPAVVAAVAIGMTIKRPFPWREPAFACLALSVLLFCIGGALGLFVDGADTRTPAHYHGVIASVTAALMGVVYTVLLPSMDRVIRARRTMLWQLHLFCWGQLVACLGLFIAGGYGAPRKAAGEAQGLDGIAQIAGMAMNGLGGMIAVIGGIIFVVMAGNALLRMPDNLADRAGVGTGADSDGHSVWRTR